VVRKGLAGGNYKPLTEEAVSKIHQTAMRIIEEVGLEVPDRVDKIRSKMQSALRNYFFFTIKRRPVILPFILEV